MPNSAASQTLFLYSTTVSDVGTVRSNNQDSSFAGEHLAAICDGMGGHAGGDTASTIAIRSLAHIEHDDVSGDIQAVSRMLETSVIAAHDAIVGKAKRERKLAGMGTTVTAVVLVAGYWVLAHIGDSRAYLLRDGKLTRMTHDHSLVQHLIDMGRINEAEAKNHPQRNVVMRVLGDFDIDPRPDIAIRKAHPADRWLLCSDGLCGVLEDSTIEQVMADCTDQEECAQRLVGMALKAGSTDNVTAVIADATLALDANAFDLPHQTLLVGGAASSSLEPIADIVNAPVATSPALREDRTSPAMRAAALREDAKRKDKTGPAPRVVQPADVREENGDRTVPDTGEIPVVQKSDGRVTADPNDPEVKKAIHHEQLEQRHAKRVRRHRNRFAVMLTSIVVLAVLAGTAWGAYAWSQSRYYLAANDGVVTIYRGVNTNLFGLSLSHEVKKTTIEVSSLPQSWQDQLDQGIAVDSYDAATEHAAFIKSELDKEAAKKAAEEEAKKQATESSKTNGDSSGSTDKSGSTSDSSSSTTDKSGTSSGSTPKIGAADDATKSDTSKDGAAQ